MYYGYSWPNWDIYVTTTFKPQTQLYTSNTVMIKAHILLTNINTNTPYHKTHKTSTLKVLNTYICITINISSTCQGTITLMHNKLDNAPIQVNTDTKNIKISVINGYLICVLQETRLKECPICANKTIYIQYLSSQ